jgi:hypothetical protein
MGESDVAGDSAMTEAQTVGRLIMRPEFCELHRRDFVKTFFPPVPGQAGFWIGECEKCTRDKDLVRQADALLSGPKQINEKSRRVGAAMATREPEIEAAIDESMDEEREERRAEWRQHIEESLRKEVEAQIEGEMRREILEGLKTQEPSASAAGR